MSLSSFASEMASLDPDEISKMFDQVADDTRNISIKKESPETLAADEQEITTEVVPE